MERAATVRYYLGRGRRAREAGRFEAACSEARRAIDANPGNPWSHALLGQCLLRQRRPDLVEARRALERACALDQTNGYFVRLLLEVLDAQGDVAARQDALAWAWWRGAPVDRWLPNGAPVPRQSEDSASKPVAEATSAAIARPVSPARMPEVHV
jgi:predicted Zn-dependent protease